MPGYNNGKSLEVTTDWGQGDANGTLTELPSGKVVRVKRALDFSVQLQAGLIPNPLASIVFEMMGKQTAEFPQDKMDREVLLQMLALVDRTVCSSVTEPRFSMPAPRGLDETDEQYAHRLSLWQPEEGTLSIFLMDLNDRMFILNVAQGMAADLASFREEPAPDVEPVPASQGVRGKAKRSVAKSGGK